MKYNFYRLYFKNGYMMPLSAFDVVKRGKEYVFLNGLSGKDFFINSKMVKRIECYDHYGNLVSSDVSRAARQLV